MLKNQFIRYSLIFFVKLTMLLFEHAIKKCLAVPRYNHSWARLYFRDYFRNFFKSRCFLMIKKSDKRDSLCVCGSCRYAQDKTSAESNYSAADFWQGLTWLTSHDAFMCERVLHSARTGYINFALVYRRVCTGYEMNFFFCSIRRYLD